MKSINAGGTNIEPGLGQLRADSSIRRRSQLAQTLKRQFPRSQRFPASAQTSRCVLQKQLEAAGLTTCQAGHLCPPVSVEAASRKPGHADCTFLPAQFFGLHEVEQCHQHPRDVRI